MRYALNDHIHSVHAPPISEVKGWLKARPDDGLTLIDLCQAVPDYAPAPALTAHLASLLDDPLISKYSPDEGLPEVLQSVCGAYQRNYGASLSPGNICLTIGASQAFWLAMVTLCRAGDEVIVQAPCYFDHPMALEMLGLKSIQAPFNEAMEGLPSPEVMESLITERTRAILLVTPSNPTGAITPPDTLEALFCLAQRHNLALILDETYNAFIPGGTRPHQLFIRPDWADHLIQIASFGKTFALTGYRAGALIASPHLIGHALKAQDTMAVCQPRITQHAVQYGLDHLDQWVAANRDMMTRRHDLFREEFLKPGNAFRLAASGAFFAWVRHPCHASTGREVARRLVHESGVLCLPGEVFGTGLEGFLRLAFGNIREELIPEAVRRFREFRV